MKILITASTPFFSDRVCHVPRVSINMRVGGCSNKNIRSMIRKSMEDYEALKINGLSGGIFALFFKNVSKIPQFFNTNGKRGNGK